MQAIHNGVESVGGQVQNQYPGELFKKFSPAALKDLSSIAASSTYDAGFALYSERDESHGIYIVLEGEVKLSINSSEGRRLSLRIARKGDILGLASALSGSPYETTAETVYPSRLVPIGRREFLGFMMRHPEAYQVLSEELTREFTMACEQLRTVGLSSSAPEKLARLGRAVLYPGSGSGPAAGGHRGAVAHRGLEREWPDLRVRDQVPVLNDTRGDRRVYRGVARDGDENAEHIQTSATGGIQRFDIDDSEQGGAGELCGVLGVSSIYLFTQFFLSWIRGGTLE